MSDQASIESRYAALKEKLGADEAAPVNDPPAPEPTAVDTSAVDVPAKEDEPKAVAADSAAAKDAEELFPGYSKLDEAARAEIDKIVADRDAQRQAREQIEIEAKRYRNQVLPVQQKLSRTEAELKRLRSAQQPSPKPAETPAPPQGGKKFLENLPDEAAEIEALVSAKLDPIAKENQELKSLVQQLAEEREHEKVVVELTRMDPQWQEKVTSDDFSAWATAITDERGEFYDPVMAQAIARLYDTDDINAMRSILRHFDRDLAEANAMLTSEAGSTEGAPARAATPAKPTVRKPNPDPSPRRVAVAPTAPVEFQSDLERRWAEAKARAAAQ